MKKFNCNGDSTRSPLNLGITCVISSILIILLLLAAQSRIDTDSRASGRVDDEWVTTTMTTTVTNSMTSSTTSSTSTTKKTTATTTQTVTTVTTVQTNAQESIQATEAPEPAPVEESEPIIEPEPVIEPVVEPEPVVEQPQPVTSPPSNGLPITDYERTLLRNVVAREYGSDWVSTYEKAKVVAVVMNRVNSPAYPNTIEGVLTQPYQFSGYYACSYEWSNVTQSCRDAVDYYFAHPEEFGGWLSFWGDGKYNHFS